MHVCIVINLSHPAVGDCRDGDKMAPSVEKKIAELEMGLLHLQQNIDIPEITLVIHPKVAETINKCTQEGRKTKVSDFGDKAEEANFLNALQSGVNRWIREIQKVSRLCFNPMLVVANLTKTKSCKKPENCSENYKR